MSTRTRRAARASQSRLAPRGGGRGRGGGGGGGSGPSSPPSWISDDSEPSQAASLTLGNDSDGEHLYSAMHEYHLQQVAAGTDGHAVLPFGKLPRSLVTDEQRAPPARGSQSARRPGTGKGRAGKGGRKKRARSRKGRRRSGAGRRRASGGVLGASELVGEYEEDEDVMSDGLRDEVRSSSTRGAKMRERKAKHKARTKSRAKKLLRALTGVAGGSRGASPLPDDGGVAVEEEEEMMMAERFFVPDSQKQPRQGEQFVINVGGCKHSSRPLLVSVAKKYGWVIDRQDPLPDELRLFRPTLITREKEKAKNRNRNPNVDLMWTQQRFSALLFSQNLRADLVNQLPDVHVYMRKAFLNRALHHFHKLFPAQFDFFPISWDLGFDNEWHEFCRVVRAGSERGANGRLTPSPRPHEAGSDPPSMSLGSRARSRSHNEADEETDHDENGAENGGLNRTLPTYILKPSRGMQGDGIILVQTMDDVRRALKSKNKKQKDLDKRFIAQRYIANPLLVENLKFDMRLYVLVDHVKPLRAYVFRDGLARFCTEPYVAPDRSNLQRTFMHLTNYSLNKYSSLFRAASDGADGADGDSDSDAAPTAPPLGPDSPPPPPPSSRKGRGVPPGMTGLGGIPAVDLDDKTSKRSIATVLEQLVASGVKIDKEQFWRDVEDIVAKTLLCIWAPLWDSYCQAFDHRSPDSPLRGKISWIDHGTGPVPKRAFHVLGFDILVDDDMKLWLLEVNASPSMGTSALLDLRLKQSVLERSMEINGFIKADDYEKHKQALKETQEKLRQTWGLPGEPTSAELERVELENAELERRIRESREKMERERVEAEAARKEMERGADGDEDDFASDEEESLMSLTIHPPPPPAGAPPDDLPSSPDVDVGSPPEPPPWPAEPESYFDSLVSGTSTPGNTSAASPSPSSPNGRRKRKGRSRRKPKRPSRSKSLSRLSMGLSSRGDVRRSTAKKQRQKSKSKRGSKQSKNGKAKSRGSRSRLKKSRSLAQLEDADDSDEDNRAGRRSRSRRSRGRTSQRRAKTPGPSTPVRHRRKKSHTLERAVDLRSMSSFHLNQQAETNGEGPHKQDLTAMDACVDYLKLDCRAVLPMTRFPEVSIFGEPVWHRAFAHFANYNFNRGVTAPRFLRLLSAFDLLDGRNVTRVDGDLAFQNAIKYQDEEAGRNYKEGPGRKINRKKLIKRTLNFQLFIEAITVIARKRFRSHPLVKAIELVRKRIIRSTYYQEQIVPLDKSGLGDLETF